MNAPICKLPGCKNSRYFDRSTGNYFDYCSKTCADAGKRLNQQHHQHNQQIIPPCHCRKPRRVENGQLMGFCSRTCALKAKALLTNSHVPVCPQCNAHPCYYDSNKNSYFGFCSKHCALKAKIAQPSVIRVNHNVVGLVPIRRMCKICFVKPVHVDKITGVHSKYCSRTCRDSDP